MEHHIKITRPSVLSGVKVGPSFPVRIMGVINVSPESFYPGSVGTTEKSIGKKAEALEREGADFIDVGAMSSAPYLRTEISENEEARRLKTAVRVIRKACSLPISIDTYRWRPAEEGFAAGASILNDITGLSATPPLGRLAKKAAGLLLMAHPRSLPNKKFKNPIRDVKDLLARALRRAELVGISKTRIVLDPGIGFFRSAKFPWWKWDLLILRDLRNLLDLGFPLLAGVSRKSFIGHLGGGLPASERLSGSLAATVVAIMNGVSLIRTHDVGPTRQAAKIAKSLRNF